LSTVIDSGPYSACHNVNHHRRLFKSGSLAHTHRVMT